MRMTTDYALPDIDSLREYLALTGWSLISIGADSESWQREQAQLEVPDDDHADLVRGVVERVAAVERRSPAQIAHTIRHLYYDVTHLRATNDSWTNDAIPLATAATIIAS